VSPTATPCPAASRSPGRTRTGSRRAGRRGRAGRPAGPNRVASVVLPAPTAGDQRDRGSLGPAAEPWGRPGQQSAASRARPYGRRSQLARVAAATGRRRLLGVADSGPAERAGTGTRASRRRAAIRPRPLAPERAGRATGPSRAPPAGRRRRQCLGLLAAAVTERSSADRTPARAASPRPPVWQARSAAAAPPPRTARVARRTAGRGTARAPVHNPRRAAGVAAGTQFPCWPTAGHPTPRRPARRARRPGLPASPAPRAAWRGNDIATVALDRDRPEHPECALRAGIYARPAVGSFR